MDPVTFFIVYNEDIKKQYFEERLNLIPHDILFEVHNIYDETTMSYKVLSDFELSQWRKIFTKIDALAFCCEFLKEEASSYKKFRENLKDTNGIYLEKQKKHKDVTLKKSAELHLQKTIELLYELTGNIHNIKILQEINIVKPPKQQEYFNDITKTTTSLLSKAEFTPEEIKKILPLLKSFYKNKIF